MAFEENVQVVRDLYAAFAQRDVEAAIALTDPEGELVATSTAERTGEAEPYRGAGGLRRYFEDVARVWDELEISPEDYRAAGDSVIVFGHVRGRADGEPFEMRVTWVWKLRAQRAVSLRIFPAGGPGAPAGPGAT